MVTNEAYNRSAINYLLFQISRRSVIQYPARERDHRDFHSLKLDIRLVKSPHSEIAYSRDSLIPISAIESWVSKLLKMSAAFLFEIFTH